MGFSNLQDAIYAYYDALNSHKVEECMKFLDDNIKVTFPDASRNWNGLENASIKFGGMYERNPEFYGEIMSILTMKSFTRGNSTMEISAFFGDKNETVQNKKNSAKVMIYHLKANCKIFEINHT